MGKTISDVWHQSVQNLERDLALIDKNIEYIEDTITKGHYDLLESSLNKIWHELKEIRIRRMFNFIRSAGPQISHPFDFNNTYDIQLVRLQSMPTIGGSTVEIRLRDHQNNECKFELHVDTEGVKIYEHTILPKTSRQYWDLNKFIENKEITKIS